MFSRRLRLHSNNIYTSIIEKEAEIYSPTTTIAITAQMLLFLNHSAWAITHLKTPVKCLFSVCLLPASLPIAL